MIWIMNTHEKMDFVNTWMITYTGKPAEALAGNGWRQVIHPDDLPSVVENMQRFAQLKQSYEEEVRFRRADDEYLWHLRRITPLKDASGEVVKWIGINTDIHSQKLVEAALRDNEVLREAQIKLKIEKDFSENLLENSIDGIVAFDKNCHITAWNKMMEELNGISKEEVLGKNIFELFPEYEVNDEGKAVMRALAGEKTTLHDHPYGIRNGFYEVHTLPLLGDNQEPAGGITIIHDVTERIKIEQERINLKLTQQKEMLNAILEAQETERSRIAESLHNGLAQTLYAAKLNLEQMYLNDEQADEHSLKKTKQKVNELLIEAIRETRSISHEMVPTALQDFGLAGAIKDFVKKYIQPNFKIITEIYGFGDRLERYLELAIYRIAQELMNNVVKHAEASEAKIQVVQSEGRIIIKVTDNGKGFDVEAVNKGMGLKSIKERVKLMNGAINMQSNPGEGATIIITIPYKD
jgi:PAS domain S-box-containing protein